MQDFNIVLKKNLSNVRSEHEKVVLSPKNFGIDWESNDDFVIARLSQAIMENTGLPCANGRGLLMFRVQRRSNGDNNSKRMEIKPRTLAYERSYYGHKVRVIHSGRYTIVIHKKYGVKGVARFNPSPTDTYDHELGFKLAFWKMLDRLNTSIFKEVLKRVKNGRSKIREILTEVDQRCKDQRSKITEIKHTEGGGVVEA